MPAIFLIGFIPMLLVAYAYRSLTSFFRGETLRHDTPSLSEITSA